LRQLFAEPDAWCYDTVKVAGATAPAMPVSLADVPVGLAATA